MSQTPDDETPLSPEESLRLLTDQRTKANRAFQGTPLMYWGPWGGAWLISFGLYFLYYGLDGEPYVSMPASLPLIVLFSLMAVAMATTMYAGAKATRHIQGPSNTQGMMFGLSWFFGFLTVVAAGRRFGDLLEPDETGLLWAGLSVGLTGALYLAGSAMWQDWAMFIMGLWLTVVNAIGITLGPGWHALLVSVAGGGGLLIAAFVLHVRGIGWRS